MIHETVRMTNLSVHQIKKLVFVILCVLFDGKRATMGISYCKLEFKFFIQNSISGVM